MWSCLLGVLSIALLLALVRQRYTVVTVLGSSMVPTLWPGDRVVVRRVAAGRLRVDQVVVIERPGEGGGWHTPRYGARVRREWMVKRVVALPGDPRPDGLPDTTDAGSVRVPAGALVVLGDNASESYDSRQIGYVPADRLLGIVTRRIQPGSARPDPPGRHYPLRRGST